MVDFIHQPAGVVRLGDYLKTHFQQENWTSFRAAVAFVKRSGTRHIRGALSQFSQRAAVKISVGIDVEGTSLEGLQDLIESVGQQGEIWVYHNENNSTFHPKLYLFKDDFHADVLIGSGNLTEGGLFTNYEASFSVSLDLALQSDRDLLKNIEDVLDGWSHLAQGTSLLLTSELLDQLVENGNVPAEAQAKEIEERTEHFRRTAERATRLPLFARLPVPKAPPIPEQISVESEGEAVIEEDELNELEDVIDEDFEIEELPPIAAQEGNFTGFLMTLQRTDVGHGQTTEGTSRRSPEIFIPLIARDYDKDFWGWPGAFVDDPEKPGKKDRRGVKMRFRTLMLDVNMFFNPDKHDLRLRNETLRSAGRIGDIIQIERADGQQGFSYWVEIIQSDAAEYQHFLAHCTQKTPNSQKKWGYY